MQGNIWVFTQLFVHDTVLSAGVIEMSSCVFISSVFPLEGEQEVHGEEFGVFVSGGVKEHSEITVHLDNNSLPFRRLAWTGKKEWNKLYQCFSIKSGSRWTWIPCTTRLLLDGWHFQPHWQLCCEWCSYCGKIL